LYLVLFCYARVGFECIRAFRFELLFFVLHFVLHLLIMNFFLIVSASEYKLIKSNHLNFDVSWIYVVVIYYSIIFLLLWWSWNISFVTTINSHDLCKMSKEFVGQWCLGQIMTVLINNLPFYLFTQRLPSIIKIVLTAML
jgi:hypothetical protein